MNHIAPINQTTLYCKLRILPSALNIIILAVQYHYTWIGNVRTCLFHKYYKKFVKFFIEGAPFHINRLFHQVRTTLICTSHKGHGTIKSVTQPPKKCSLAPFTHHRKGQFIGVNRIRKWLVITHINFLNEIFNHKC